MNSFRLRDARHCALTWIAIAMAACGGGGGAAAVAAATPETTAESTPTGTSATLASSAGIPLIDSAFIAGKISEGSGERRISTTGEVARRDAGAIGASRTICPPSHFAFDDPLVLPGQPGRSHLHVFFGNTAVNAYSTPESVRTTGDSTCRGGIINRSAYWAPALIDTANGRPIVPKLSTPGNELTPIYYKTGYFGVRDADVRAVPEGFRMIAGDSKSRVAQSRVVHFSCGGGETATIPNCGAGTTLRMSITFPQCWDGVNLSSPDHRSHVAYPTEGRGCVDSRYPVAIPEISMQIYYTVPDGGSRNLRLSSDINGTPAGASAHADWINGWDEDIMTLWVTRIINLGLSSSGAVGDGRSLF